ncbi:helix-turn-helix domain-containing protein [Terriglobus sp. YAF25]|uniref:helix-turn-helix domain-containing protein n=1 Tax=Terriglobus sp. YAF25 TaxID=3233080 RepID=UPI003F95B4D6
MATTLPPPVQESSETSGAIEAHVQRVLHSPHFARAETQRKLLQYLWEHRFESVSEYAIATEALGRHSNFDSTTDASVRVHISRLRRKLKDYYQQETDEPELLVIPTGTHQLMVLDHPAPAIVAPLPEPDLDQPRSASFYRRRSCFRFRMPRPSVSAPRWSTTTAIFQRTLSSRR